MYTALSCPSQKPITSANVEHRLFMARKREQEAERGRRMDRRRTKEQGERRGTGKRKQPSHTRNEGRKYTSLRVPDHFVPAAQRRYSTIDRYTLCPIIRNRVLYYTTTWIRWFFVLQPRAHAIIPSLMSSNSCTSTRNFVEMAQTIEG